MSTTLQLLTPMHLQGRTFSAVDVLVSSAAEPVDRARRGAGRGRRLPGPGGGDDGGDPARRGLARHPPGAAPPSPPGAPTRPGPAPRRRTEPAEPPAGRSPIPGRRRTLLSRATARRPAGRGPEPAVRRHPVAAGSGAGGRRRAQRRPARRIRIRAAGPARTAGLAALAGIALLGPPRHRRVALVAPAVRPPMCCLPPEAGRCTAAAWGGAVGGSARGASSAGAAGSCPRAGRRRTRGRACAAAVSASRSDARISASGCSRRPAAAASRTSRWCRCARSAAVGRPPGASPPSVQPGRRRPRRRRRPAEPRQTLQRLAELARHDPHLVRVALRDLRQRLQVLVGEQPRVGLGRVDRVERRSRSPSPGPARAGSARPAHPRRAGSGSAARPRRPGSRTASGPPRPGSAPPSAPRRS